MKLKIFKRLLTIITVIASVNLIGCTSNNYAIKPEITVPRAVVEAPEVEDDIDIIVVESEIEEPKEEPKENISRDYKTLYGLDFDVPVYTEEELAKAKEIINSKESDFDKITSKEEYISLCTEIEESFYIVYQEASCRLYSELKNVDLAAISNDYHPEHGCYYYDDNTGFLYFIRSNGFSIHGNTSGYYFEIDMYGDYPELNNVIGKIERPDGLFLGICIAPNTIAYTDSQKVLEHYYYTHVKYYAEDSKSKILSKEEFIRYGWAPIK